MHVLFQTLVYFQVCLLNINTWEFFKLGKDCTQQNEAPVNELWHLKPQVTVCILLRCVLVLQLLYLDCSHMYSQPLTSTSVFGHTQHLQRLQATFLFTEPQKSEQPGLDAQGKFYKRV